MINLDFFSRTSTRTEDAPMAGTPAKHKDTVPSHPATLQKVSGGMTPSPKNLAKSPAQHISWPNDCGIHVGLQAQLIFDPKSKSDTCLQE